MDRLSIAAAMAAMHQQMRAAASCARPWIGTIRGRILAAFLAMSVITGTLGLYSAQGIDRAGVLVAKTYDHSLMSINYARAAAADFAAMQAAFARRWVAADADLRRQIDEKVEKLEKSLAEDLAIAAERSQSARAVQTVAHHRLIDGDELRTTWRAIDEHAATVEQQIDLLVNYVAGDGFTYRQTARATVARDTRLNILAGVLAVLLSGLVTWLLGRRIIGPVAAASAVAERIAGGNLEGSIPSGREDELGTLLKSMGVMRENIKAMMEREVAQRRSAQARLADAMENSGEGVLVIDAEGRIALVNARRRTSWASRSNNFSVPFSTSTPFR
jgi:nitrogen fixation/metabolism regulation signal transduction histidine kinase